MFIRSIFSLVDFGGCVSPGGATVFAHCAAPKKYIQKSGKIVMDFLTDSRKPHRKILKTVGGDRFCVKSTFMKSRTEIRVLLCNYEGYLGLKSLLFNLLTCSLDMIRSLGLSIE